MMRGGKRRFFAWLAMATLGMAALTALVTLYLLPARPLRRSALPPVHPVSRTVPAPATAEKTENGSVSTAQLLLADASHRQGIAAPPESADLFAAAEKAVRAVLPGEEPVFARYGVPGVAVTLLDDHTALAEGLAALASGKVLRYRVRVFFLPGGYREAAWPEFMEGTASSGYDAADSDSKRKEKQ